MSSGSSDHGLSEHLRKLLGHSAIYGSADVFSNVVSLGLLRVFTSYLSAAEYGVFAGLLAFSAVAKIVFRMGLDGAFFRVHYDQPSETAQRRLAGTVALFAGGAGTLFFGAVVLWRDFLTRLLFGAVSPPSHWITLCAADVFLGVFAFVPLNLLRIQERPGLFSLFSTGRHTLNIVLKVVLVVQGWGVAGILWSDLLATSLFVLALSPILLRNASLAFSVPLLRASLGFGLPKVPHGLMIQAQNLADRPILLALVDVGQVGIYQVGYTLGTAVKFALSAFEPAWQPFVYSRLRTSDHGQTLARVVTYAFAGFVAVGLAVAVLSRELVLLMTTPEFHGAAPVVPVVTLAYVLHGVFLLGSIGIAIRKATVYYPLITATAATTNIAANLWLIPRVGILGAAWATVLSYGVMAGLGVWISMRLLPLPFEWGRLGRLVAAAALSYGASLVAPEPLLPALLIKGLALALFPALLVELGFVPPHQWKSLRRRLA